jgi:hypothetical protein
LPSRYASGHLLHLPTHPILNGESDAQPLIAPPVEDLKRRGLAVESDGATVFAIAEAGDRKEMPPLLLAKGDAQRFTRRPIWRRWPTASPRWAPRGSCMSWTSGRHATSSRFSGPLARRGSLASRNCAMSASARSMGRTASPTRPAKAASLGSPICSTKRWQGRRCCRGRIRRRP